MYCTLKNQEESECWYSVISSRIPERIQTNFFTTLFIFVNFIRSQKLRQQEGECKFNTWKSSYQS